MPEPAWSPFDGPDAERLEADWVTTEAQLVRFVTTGCVAPQTEEISTQKARGNEPLRSVSTCG